MLGVSIYMKDTLKERFGIGGPGSTLVTLVTFMILLQTSVGLINGIGLFETNVAPTPNQYQNVDLSTQTTNLNNQGGLFADILSSGSIVLDIFISAIKMGLTIIASIAVFAVVLASIYPWMAATTGGALVLTALQVGIWLLYAFYIYDLFVKPPNDLGVI
jgi:hypothetical protein